ncbi:MAG: hypothetical protein A2441_04140, partial [Candidatus Veblenbacteria bacterium RIFOXYC2_FULL_42_11]
DLVLRKVLRNILSKYMALVKCNECGKAVSNVAPTCPNCGNPIQPILIEQTAKMWKGPVLIAWLVLIAGIFLFLTTNEQGKEIVKFAMYLGFFGIVVFKVIIWWNHK